MLFHQTSSLPDTSFSAIFLRDIALLHPLSHHTRLSSIDISSLGRPTFMPCPQGVHSLLFGPVNWSSHLLPASSQSINQTLISAPPTQCNLRHIHWLTASCQALFWVLKKENYRFTDLLVYKSFKLSHRSFRTNSKSQLNWQQGVGQKKHSRTRKKEKTGILKESID